jgi:hypothetical protein
MGGPIHADAGSGFPCWPEPANHRQFRRACWQSLSTKAGLVKEISAALERDALSRGVTRALNVPAIRYPKPSAHLAPYVEVLGPEIAIVFLLRFGGSRLYFPDRPGGRSNAEAVIGPENFQRLASVLGSRLTNRVPIGNRWLVAALAAQGKSIGEIARTVRATDVSVHKWLRYAEDRMNAGKPV